MSTRREVVPYLSFKQVGVPASSAAPTCQAKPGSAFTAAICRSASATSSAGLAASARRSAAAAASHSGAGSGRRGGGRATRASAIACARVSRPSALPSAATAALRTRASARAPARRCAAPAARATSGAATVGRTGCRALTSASAAAAVRGGAPSATAAAAPRTSSCGEELDAGVCAAAAARASAHRPASNAGGRSSRGSFAHAASARARRGRSAACTTAGSALSSGRKPAVHASSPAVRFGRNCSRGELASRTATASQGSHSPCCVAASRRRCRPGSKALPAGASVASCSRARVCGVLSTGLTLAGLQGSTAAVTRSLTSKTPTASLGDSWSTRPLSARKARSRQLAGSSEPAPKSQQIMGAGSRASLPVVTAARDRRRTARGAVLPGCLASARHDPERFGASLLIGERDMAGARVERLHFSGGGAGLPWPRREHLGCCAQRIGVQLPSRSSAAPSD